jgi:NAD(P)-dependent dehydrogenase (short-subunit alcohol dehydrogenase family)
VTGGSSGIGLEIARLLGRRGFGLTIAARRPEKLETAVEGLREEGFEVQGIAAQLSEEEAVRTVVDGHRERFGRCDVLVNNIGIGLYEPIAELTAKQMDMQIGVNIKSALFFTRDCVEMLERAAAEHGSSLLVNTSSIVAVHAQGELSIYSATKAAVNSFTASMYRELSAKGIKSTALCPGFVDTPMTDWAKEGVAKDKMIQPEDVAGAVGLMLDLSPACVIPEFHFIRRGRATN